MAAKLDNSLATLAHELLGVDDALICECLTNSLSHSCTKLSSIVNLVDTKLDCSSDPRQYGKGLTANRSGQWRYRVGDYRLLAEIQDDKVVILILHVGHRSDIYN